MKRVPDYQRKKVYDAENEAFGGEFNWKIGKFDTLGECEIFAKKIVESDYWKSQKGWKKIKLKCGRGCRNAFYRPSDRTVTLPKWARNEHVIIHEFAHYLTHYLTHRTHEDGSAHGSFFAGHYLMLVDELLGSDHSMALMEHYEKQGVRYNI